MPIHFRCPHCEKLLAIGTAKGGTQIQCPMCTRPITVPPRTEVKLPTTTVMPPELAQSWWMDAPPAVPPQVEPPPQSSSPPPADAWWLMANVPPKPAETVATPPPSVPPPLPQTLVPVPPTEPPSDLLVFEPATKTPTLGTNPTRAAARFFTPLHILLVVGAVVVSLLALSVLFVLLRGAEPTPQPPATKSADAEKDEKPTPSKRDTDDKPMPSIGSASSRQRRERTEEELRQESAAFPEIALDRRDEPTEAQRVRRPTDPQWLTQRPDLAGLPIREEKDRILEPAAAEQLQAGALALRAQLFAAAQGGDRRPDAQKVRAALTAPGEQSKKWLRPESVPALQQLLMAEDAAIRQVLIEQLARIDGPRASAMLARNALFDLNPEVRQNARTALAKRPPAEYQQELLNGFRYPWPVVAEHAAAALAALKLRETVPALMNLLDPSSLTIPYAKPGKEGRYVCEVVRINHPRNCLLCHAPSLQESDKLRGFVPPADQPLPPPFTREYYAQRRPGQFVRADVTYLQQDFSVRLPVENPGKWPAVQRFDFLVRERPATDEEIQAAHRAEGKSPSAYQQAIFFVLRELTGADPGPTVEDWKRWAKHSVR